MIKPDAQTLNIGQQKSVVRVSLNRPDVRNAMNRKMVSELLDFFNGIVDNRSIRVVVISGEGQAFCAGGDIKEMKQVKQLDRGAHLQHVSDFDAMLKAVSQAPQVVIAKVHGAALGGGLGLVCAADLAVASDTAQLGFPEIRLGLAPAIISPYVVARIGLAQARRLMLTAADLNGKQAAESGLVTRSCPDGDLDAEVNHIVNAVLQASPSALAACKKLLLEMSHKPGEETVAARAEILHQLQTGEEGQEGMRAFVEKKPPGWVERIEK